MSQPCTPAITRDAGEGDCMPHAVEATCRDEPRRASLLGPGDRAPLLALSRIAPDTHLRLAEVARAAAESGIGVGRRM